MMHYRIRTICMLGITAAFAVGCATENPPTAQLAAANTAITDASAAGAPELAPSDLSTARDKLSRANTEVASKDYREASRLATEAEVDARLAQSRASAVRSQKAASTVQDDVRVLREELNRQQTQQ